MAHSGTVCVVLGGTQEMVEPALDVKKSRFRHEAGAWLQAPPLELRVLFFFNSL